MPKNLGGIKIMNQELENALGCRINLIECLNKAKEVDRSIYSVQFLHYQSTDESRKIDKVDWTEWKKLIKEFNTEKNCIPPNKHPELIQKYQKQLKELFKELILKAMIELLVTREESDILGIELTGIVVYSSFYGDFTDTQRYHIPDELYNAIKNDNQILTCDLLYQIVQEFLRENSSESFNFCPSPYQIGVPRILYWN